MGYEEDDDYLFSKQYYIDLERKEMEDDIGAPFDYKGELEKEQKRTTVETKSKSKKQGKHNKDIIIEKKTTTVETITTVSKPKDSDNNIERELVNGQKDLEGNDAILNIIEEGQKEIGKLCKEILDYFKKNLLIKDDNMIYIPYATMVTHMYPGDTVWTIIVGQSSGGKSEILRSMGEGRNEHIYPISRITQNAVISGGKGNVGIVYEANHKVVIIKDLVTAITSKNAEGIFSQIREAFDGNVNVSSGYEEGSKSAPDIRITIIAGVTPDAISGSTIFNSALGERFVYYFYPKFEMEDIKILAAKMMGGPNDDKRRKTVHEISDKLIKKVFALRLLCFKNNIKATIGDVDYGEWLYRLGALVAILRRSVTYNWKANMIEDIGTEEGPHRITKELLKISVGLAMVKQKPIRNVIDVDEEIKNDILRICIDSIPRRRFMCLKIFLWEQKEMTKRNTYVKPVIIKERLSLEFGFSKNTARIMVNELVEMNILQYHGEEDKEEDNRILTINENFIKDHENTLDILMNYADKISVDKRSNK